MAKPLHEGSEPTFLQLKHEHLAYAIAPTSSHEEARAARSTERCKTNSKVEFTEHAKEVTPARTPSTALSHEEDDVCEESKRMLAFFEAKEAPSIRKHLWLSTAGSKLTQEWIGDIVHARRKELLRVGLDMTAARRAICGHIAKLFEFPELLLAPLSVPHDDSASPLLQALANRNRLKFEDLSQNQARTAFFKFFALLRAARPKFEQVALADFREAISELTLHKQPKDRLEYLRRVVLHNQGRDGSYRRKLLLPDWAHATEELQTIARMEKLFKRKWLLHRSPQEQQEQLGHRKKKPRGAPHPQDKELAVLKKKCREAGLCIRFNRGLCSKQDCKYKHERTPFAGKGGKGVGLWREVEG